MLSCKFRCSLRDIYCVLYLLSFCLRHSLRLLLSFVICSFLSIPSLGAWVHVLSRIGTDMARLLIILNFISDPDLTNSFGPGL